MSLCFLCFNKFSTALWSIFDITVFGMGLDGRFSQNSAEAPPLYDFNCWILGHFSFEIPRIGSSGLLNSPSCFSHADTLSQATGRPRS